MDYEIIITYKRIKNVNLRVKNGKVYISSPIKVSKERLYKFAKEHEDFIYKQLKREEEKALKFNDSITIFNKEYIVLETSTLEKVTENYIFIKKSDDLKKSIKKLFKNKLYDLMYLKTKEYFNIMGFNCKFPSIVIKDVKSKWGSYNKIKHEIIYSSNLIFKDMVSYDYLIVHELSHIIEFNHSKAFYDIVSKYCPNYKKLRKLLKE